MKTSSPKTEDLFVQQSFEAELNRHGFGFQFGLLKVVADLFEKGGYERSRWVFSVSEFPVSIQGSHTKIDFVLWNSTGDSTLGNSLMVCECKRANPDYSNWCFIRAPFSYRNRKTDRLTIDQLSSSADAVLHHTSAMGSIRDQAYHVALAVRSKDKGDAQAVSQPRTQIEDAVTQALRGLNGLIETLAMHQVIVAKQDIISFLPVIFTTARLWVSEDNLSLTDLETGRMRDRLKSFHRADWLWLQYNTSPGIKHSLSNRKPSNLQELLKMEYVRTVGVVSPSGVEEFLTTTSGIFL